jgi:uncharacterized protein YoxC
MAHVLTLLPAKARAPMRNTPNAARPASSPRANRGPAGRDGARDAFSQMVEQMPINAMMCDTKDFKITYINQTAKATDEIGAQISAMQGATDEAVKAIQAIGQTIQQVSKISSAIAGAVRQQGAATQEIARNVQQAAQGTQEVSGNISTVNRAASESGQSASNLLDAARELAKQSEVLRGEVGKFLGEVRAM